MTYRGFPVALVSALACPQDGGVFSYADRGRSHLRDARLECRECGASYEIRDGIALLLDRAALDPRMEAEERARDRDARSYDAHFAARNEREIPSVRRCVGSLKGKAVIEYGAGTGRFTEALSPGTRLYLASDMSHASLAVLARKDLPDTVGLAWAEATALRARESFFDVAVALQLVEHIPGSLRGRFYESVSRTLVAGGFFVASVYHQDVRRMLRGQSKDGTHPNGIYFHRYSAGEFRRELGERFRVTDIHPIDIMLPLEGRLALSPRIQGAISRLCERVPPLNRFGHLVLAKAYKKT